MVETKPENLEQQAAFALYNYLGPQMEAVGGNEGVDWLFKALKAFFAGKPCPEWHEVGDVNDECVSDRESTEQEDTGDSQEVAEGAPDRRVL